MVCPRVSNPALPLLRCMLIAFRSQEKRNEGQAPICKSSCLQTILFCDLHQLTHGVASNVSRSAVVVGIEELMCGNIDQESAGIRQMELDGLQKSGLILDMFEHIEQQQEIKLSTELRVTLMNVVTVKRAQAAHVLVQGDLVEFETGNWYPVVILYVLLQ